MEVRWEEIYSVKDDKKYGERLRYYNDAFVSQTPVEKDGAEIFLTDLGIGCGFKSFTITLEGRSIPKDEFDFKDSFIYSKDEINKLSLWPGYIWKNIGDKDNPRYVMAKEESIFNEVKDNVISDEIS